MTTKLCCPPTRPNLLARPRLVERLNASLHPGRKLTLVSAPAGFGKNTLVSEWVAACGRPVAWLSLDKDDSHPTRFLAYLVGAVQTVVLAIGEGALSALQSPQPPPIESILTVLLNELSTLSEPFILVLDDYHVIEAQAVDGPTAAGESKSVDEALTFLLDHLPPQMHLVIDTRENPPLPLPRYRAQGQLTEVRVADLRFTPAEAAEFLEQVMSLDLSEEDVAALETRTEGWIAGLQLADLARQGLSQQRSPSLPGIKGASRFIESFTGSHHFVLDYLIEEVLKQQPERVQTFLLQTSILDRLCGSLCDAVWGDHGDSELSLPGSAEPSLLNSQTLLKYLERSNLFLVPLDHERQYYRYHHLFADMLRHRLQRSYPEIVPRLHARAATWFEEQGSAADAIEHWIAAEDYPQAAQVIKTFGYRHFEKADFQQLSHSMRDHRKSAVGVTEKARTLMKRAGIMELEKRQVTQASGGQIQRVGICHALMSNPKIIFGDEPTGALNSTAADEIMELLAEIHRTGTMILVVTHDAKVAARTERVLFMLDGQIGGEYSLGVYQEANDSLKAREEALTSWLTAMKF